MKVNWIGVIFLIALFTCSCEKGALKKIASSSSLSVSEARITDYNETYIEVLLKAKIEIDVVDLEQVGFFLEATCKGVPLATLLVKDLIADGVTLQLDVRATSKIYVKPSLGSECEFLMNFVPELPEVKAPKVAKTSPSSPNRESHTPGIFGTVFPKQSQVEFFKDSACSMKVASGSGEELMKTGIASILPANQTTSIFARTIDPLGRESSCESVFSYRHQDLPDPSPQLISVEPVSPSNLSVMPVIIGATSEYSQSISIYSDEACQDELMTPSLEEFNQTGVQIQVEANSTTLVYGQSIDDLGNKSVCTLLVSYTRDDIPPGPPSYSSASPTTPTRLTTFPKILGVSTVDTATVRFYRDSLCLNSIGSGRPDEFQISGINVSAIENNITSIYAKNFDAAENASACTYLLDYKHNTIPPPSPAFGGSLPDSPTNQSATPLIFGVPSITTIALRLYDDEFCTNQVGTGDFDDFIGSGISVSLQENTANQLYTEAEDIEGNISACTFLSTYEHSNQPAPDPSFLFSFPQSPTKASNLPFIIGTADISIVTVDFYLDPACSTSLGSGSRVQFVSSGIQVNLPTDSTTSIYAKSTDVFGNKSNCSLLTTFIHNTVLPEPPSFTSTSPVSPNNQSAMPTIVGDVLQHPASQLPASKIIFYDSLGCISKLGEGDPVDFRSTGIQINVAANTPSNIYAKAFDDAGNSTSCTYLTDYTHNALVPAAPVLLNAAPDSPSYSTLTSLSGYFASSPDFMNRVSVGIYTDPACSNALISGAPAAFEAGGISVDVPANAVSSLYGSSVNEVGTFSACNLLMNFRHYDLAPLSPSVSSQLNGAVFFNWFPDTVSSPLPKYYVQRAVSSGGPYTMVAAGLSGNTFTDNLVSDNTQYFYRVFSSNSTGQSQYSSEQSVTISAPAPQAAVNLIAQPSASNILLAWSGFAQNMTYKVYRSTQFAGPFEKLDADPSSSVFTDDSVTNGAEYYYYVSGTNPSGESTSSNVAAATPLATPTAPLALTIEPVNGSQACGGADAIHLSWTSPSYFTNFQIYRGQSWNSPLPLMAVGTNLAVDCSPDNLFFNVYSVRANWGASSSLFSTTKAFINDARPTLTVSPGDSEIFLQWAVPANAEFYDVYRASEIEGPFTVLAASLAQNSFLDSTTTNGQSYFYKVQGYMNNFHGDHYDGFPSYTKGGIPSTLPSAPTQLTLTIDALNKPVLSWASPVKYNKFSIYRSENIGGPYTYIGASMSNQFTDFPATGMNHYYVTANWGSAETAATNTVSFRHGVVNGLSTTGTADNVQLNWNAVANAQLYHVFRSQSAITGFVEIGSTATVGYVDLTAVAAVGYYYKIQTEFSDFTQSQFSNSVGGERAGTNKPVGLTILKSTANILDVRWIQVSGAAKYDILQSSSLNGVYVKKGTTVSTQYILGGLASLTQYFIKVKSYVDGATTLSDPISAFTIPIVNPPAGEPGDGVIDLSWSPVIGAVSYDVMRSTDGLAFSSVVSGHPTSSYSDMGIANGQIYYYKLVSNFVPGASISISTLGIVPGVVPLPPTGLSVANNGTAANLLLAWAPVAGVLRYNIFMATSAAGPFNSPLFNTTATENVTVSGLSADTAYYFKVSSLLGTIESTQSETQSAITALTPAAPVAQMNDASSIVISWDVTPLAATYSVFRSDDSQSFQQITSGLAAPSFIDSTIDPNVTYYYRYLPFSAGGDVMAISTTSSAVTLGIVPLAPGDLNIYSDSLTSVILSWIKVPNIQLYEILRSNSPGGPYTVIDNVLASIETYDDVSVIAGNSYFYVVRSVTSSGVPSANSIEKGISVLAAPANLNLSNDLTGIGVSWDAVAGAVQYKVKRSHVSGGPYGQIATVAALAYLDTDVLPETAYYYAIEATFADGSSSLYSSENSILRQGTVDIQVPVELIDKPVASDGAVDKIFQRSMTSLNPNDYDGTVSYAFEIIASNTDGVARQVELVDQADVAVASMMVSAGLSSATRLRVNFTPNTGHEIYRLKVESTNVDQQLVIYSAKLLVNQIDATRSKIYYPLMMLSRDLSQQDLNGQLEQTSSGSYSALSSALFFRKDTSELKKIIDYNGWEIEALVATTGGSEGSLIFTNTSTGQDVALTQTSFLSSSIQMATVPFDEGIAGYSSTDEDDLYSIKIKCDTNCGAGSVKLFKAGLWVSLEKLSSGWVSYRIARQTDNIIAPVDLDEQRALIDLSLFTGANSYLEADITDSLSSAATVSLSSHGADSGNAGLSIITGSNLNVDADQRIVLRSASPLPLISGERVLPSVSPSAGTVDINTVLLQIYFGP